MKKKLSSDSAWYAIATISVIFSNYLFHLLSARSVSITDYGIISGLFAFFGLLGFTGVGLQTKASEITARLLAEKNPQELQRTQKLWLKRTLLSSALFFVIALLGSEIFRQFFHASLVEWIIFLLVFLVTFVLCLVRGFLQGALRYREVGISFLLESLLKLIFAGGLLYLGWGTLAVLLALFFSQIPSAILGTYQVFKYKNSSQGACHLHAPTSEKSSSHSIPFPLMIIYFGLYASWFNVDMMLIQYFYPEQSGVYSVAAKIGQVILFAASNVGTFLLPILVTSVVQKKSTKKILTIAALIILSGSLLGASILHIWSDIWVNFFFGEKYTQAQNYLLLMSLYGGIIGLTHLGVQTLFAEGTRKSKKLVLVFAVLGIMTLAWAIHIAILAAKNTPLLQIITTMNVYAFIMMVWVWSGKKVVEIFRRGRK